MRRLVAGLWSGFWLLVMLIGLPWALVAFFGWPHAPPSTGSDLPAATRMDHLLRAAVRLDDLGRSGGLHHGGDGPGGASPPVARDAGHRTTRRVPHRSGQRRGRRGHYHASRGSVVAAPPPAAVATLPQPPAAPDVLLPQATPAAYTTTTTSAPVSDVVYQARHGDWVWHIAERFLGDPHRYTDIAALNPHLAHKYGTAFPDHIEPGDQLRLPTDAHDRGPRHHATGTVLTPTPPTTNSGRYGHPARRYHARQCTTHHASRTSNTGPVLVGDRVEQPGTHNRPAHTRPHQHRRGRSHPRRQPQTVGQPEQHGNRTLICRRAPEPPRSSPHRRPGPPAHRRRPRRRRVGHRRGRHRRHRRRRPGLDPPPPPLPAPTPPAPPTATTPT